MASTGTKSLSVLAPNGRRQTVKATPNTTILQVLEEVCQKQGYSPQKWDLKHYNEVLDASSIIRFTGLANNAQLEMVARNSERATSNVTIGLQLENGTRLMGDFVPTTNLNKIINSLCAEQNDANTVIIYMHQEIHGEENLEKTTLQSLGLNNGRAMLRLLHRDLKSLSTQSHVAGQLPQKNSKGGKNSRDNQSTSSIQSQLKKVFDPLSFIKSEKSNQDNAKDKEKKKKPNQERKMSGKGYVLGSGPSPSDQAKKTEALLNKIQPPPKAANPTSESMESEFTEEIEFLGERNALIFNQAGAKAIPHDTLPDDFFDLTVNDAKVLIRDAKQQRAKFEDAPFVTKAQRELEHNRQILNRVHKYRQTVIRIQFPNQLVLQGIFTPLETVQHVKDFVKEYLEHPDQEFTLYCTPPKKNLTPEVRLVEENLVPSAIIYYSGTSGLKPSLSSKLIDPEVASRHAIKSRIKMTRSDPPSLDDPNANVESEVKKAEVAEGESSMTDRIKNYTPTWFKNTFK